MLHLIDLLRRRLGDRAFPVVRVLLVVAVAALAAGAAFSGLR